MRFHDAKKKNLPIRSINADILKFSKSICFYCNNTRTQPHDRAWERMSAWFRAHRSSTAPGMSVRANRIFPYDTRRQMLNVHLYFVKVLGCQIVDSNIHIDLGLFSDAVILTRAHPQVYLKFGQSGFVHGLVADGSNLKMESIRGVCKFLTWFRGFRDVTINLMYAADGKKRDGLGGAWHPRDSTNKLVISDFRR